MPIPVICPCSAKLKVGDHLAGKQIKCPKCGSLIFVGSGDGPPGAPPPPPLAAAPAPAAEQVLAESGYSDKERERLEDTLEEGEHLLWAGKPVPGAAFFAGWIFSSIFFFGALVCLICMAIVIGNNIGGAGVVACVLFAVLFIAAGMAMPFLNRRRYGLIAYAVTDRRALAWDADWLGRVSAQVYKPAQLSKMGGMGTTAAGVGSLVFGRKVVTRKTQHGTQQFAGMPYGFFYIPRAAEVERLMREQLIDPFTDKLYE
jgi:hypothetical protein